MTGHMRKNFLNDLVFRTRLIGFEYHLDSKREGANAGKRMLEI